MMIALEPSLSKQLLTRRMTGTQLIHKKSDRRHPATIKQFPTQIQVMSPRKR